MRHQLAGVSSFGAVGLCLQLLSVSGGVWFRCRYVLLVWGSVGHFYTHDSRAMLLEILSEENINYSPSLQTSVLFVELTIKVYFFFKKVTDSSQSELETVSLLDKSVKAFA